MSATRTTWSPAACAPTKRWPEGRAYLMRTSDPQRDCARGRLRAGATAHRCGYPIDIVKADALARRRDVMFYFTGLRKSPASEPTRTWTVRWPTT
jgi:hypothetical protein